jgi:hypothetical protein
MIIADSLYYTKFKLHCRVSFCLLFTTSFMQYRIGGKCVFVLLRRKKKKETFQYFDLKGRCGLVLACIHFVLF